MESEQSNSSKMETFRLYDDKPQPGVGLNFLESPENPFPPLLPCIEVVPSQGRVNTKEVFAFSNLDLVPGNMKIVTVLICVAGGLKLWEGSLDLVKTLRSEMEDGKLSFSGKRVLE
ncbi:hypothetical protein ACH5RR_032628, partial [Cinchona calisaya]